MKGLLASLGIKTAKEIRDWYVSRGFPESVAERIASGELDPSFDAAIQRSIDQGFLNQDMFHAPGRDGFIGNEINIGVSQNGDFGVPQQAFFLSSSPKNSETYLGQTWLAADNPALKDYSGGIVQNDVAKIYANGANLMPMRIKPGKYDQYFGGVYGPEIHDEIADAASRGMDSVIYDDFIDPGFFQLGQAKPQRTAAIINPNNIRSKFAMFDPEYTGPNILGSAAATAGALGLLASPEEAEAGFINRGGRTLLEAFHGSPYRFNRFDMSKIGTGEGAQAYGYGLYFADSEDVARGYRDALTNISSNAFGGAAVPDATRSGLIDISNSMRSNSLDPTPGDFAADGIDELIAGDFSIDTIRRQVRQNAIDEGVNPDEAIKLFENAVDYANKNKGALYRTEIDVTPDQMLDWDTPISQQPDAIKEAAQNYFDLFRKDDGIADYLDPIFNDEYEDMTGKEFYQTLENLYSEGYLETPIGNTLADDALMRGNIPEATSASLLDDNIKGIQYFDANSRRAGEGTRNYVIFDEEPIRIAERGSADPRLLAGMAGGGLLAASAPSLFEYSPERALQAANQGLLGDAMTLDEQADMAHRRLVNERMGALGMLQDPMYEYGTILPQKTNVATGETSLAFPKVVQGLVGALMDIGSTRDTKRYNPAALLEVL